MYHLRYCWIRNAKMTTNNARIANINGFIDTSLEVDCPFEKVSMRGLQSLHCFSCSSSILWHNLQTLFENLLALVAKCLPWVLTMCLSSCSLEGKRKGDWQNLHLNGVKDSRSFGRLIDMWMSSVTLWTVLTWSSASERFTKKAFESSSSSWQAAHEKQASLETQNEIQTLVLKFKDEKAQTYWW